MAAYTSNDGDQTITFDFQQEATSLGFNQLLREVLRPGIYEGGLLTKNDESSASISPYTVIINAENEPSVAVKVESQTSYTITGISATNFIIVLRFGWYPQAENYVQAMAIPSGSFLETDIVVGTANYSSGSLVIESDNENYPRLQISKDADTILLGEDVSIESNPSIGTSSGDTIPTAFVGDQTYVTEVLQNIYDRLIDLSGVRDESVKARHVDFDLVDGVNASQLKNSVDLAYEGLTPGNITANTTLDSVLQQIINLYKDLDAVNNNAVDRRHINFGLGSTQISLKDFVLGQAGSQGVDGAFSDFSYGTGDTVQSALNSLASIINELATFVNARDNDQGSIDSRVTNIETDLTGKQRLDDIPVGTIWMYHGPTWSSSQLPGWEVCDGVSGRPNLINRFVKGASSTSAVTTENVKGSNTYKLSMANIPIHDHPFTFNSASGSTNNTGEHSHTYYRDKGKEGAGRNQSRDRNREAAQTSTDGNHTHTVTIDSMSAEVGNAGSSNPSPITINPEHYELIFIIKVS